MAKARDIKRDMIRAERGPLLAELDVLQLRALVAGDISTSTIVEAKKQALRDAPADPAIDAAETPEALAALPNVPDEKRG